MTDTIGPVACSRPRWRLVRELEEELGLVVSLREIFEDMSTPADLAALVEASPGAPVSIELAPSPTPTRESASPPSSPSEPAGSEAPAVDLASLARQLKVIAGAQGQTLERLTELTGLLRSPS